ncbi:hypothetical protein ACHAQD_011015 [Fusarium lateritium]
MTSVDLSTSRAHEVQPSEAEVEIDEVDFDDFIMNQPPEDQVQDIQQDGAEYIEGFDPGAMPY